MFQHAYLGCAAAERPGPGPGHMALCAAVIAGLTLAGCAPDAAVAPRDDFGSTAGGTHPAGPEAAMNAKRGSITIGLVMRPEVGVDAAFLTEGKGLRSFVLDDDGDAKLPNVRTFSNLAPGVYAVQLAAPPDGPVTDIRCTSTGGADDNIVDLATGKATVTVQAGESIRCVFVDGWAEDDLETVTQSQWGDETSNAASILAASFSSVFGRLLQIGGERVAVFSSASAIITYLPALGTSGPLSEDVLNPVVTNSGEMGGEVLALRLNIDFSRASILGSTTRLGELRFCDVTSLPLLNGQTVDLFSTTANQLLGGETAPIGSSTATAVLRLVNAAFAEGTPSSFAQLVLFDGDCP